MFALAIQIDSIERLEDKKKTLTDERKNKIENHFPYSVKS